MTGDPHPEALRAFARELALLGSHTARRLFGRVRPSRKADDTPVTQADHATQAVILAALAERFPTHAVLVEEDLARPERHAAAADAAYCWVVDPVDGTRNFSRGVRVYAVSVAVLHAGRPIAGAVYDASSGKVYSAARGSGAFCDDEGLSLANRPIDTDTTLAIGSFRHRAIPQPVRAWMDQYLFRNFGSLCMHFAWVAAGLVDAAYALECKLWDAAAAALIIEEAGGRVTNHRGEAIWPVNPAAYRGEDLPILAGTPRLHAALLHDLLAEYPSG